MCANVKYTFTGDLHMRISLVIPFYNAMPLLRDLTDSICRNMAEIDDRHSFEFVFANDGSTDDYAALLDEFSKKFPLVKVISQENGGVAKARNNGINSASGDYIWFVDADDMVEEHAFCSILNALKDTVPPDIIFCDCKGYEDQHNYYHSFSYKYSDCMRGVWRIENEDDRSLVYDALFGKLRINYAIWYQLFRREFLRENEIYFDTKLKTSEDMDFKFKTLSTARSVMGIDVCTYVYRLPNDARTSLSKSGFSCEQLVLLCDMYSGWYDKFSEMNAIVSPDTNGYGVMKNKFALLVYSAYKLLLQQKDDEAVGSYLAEKEPYLAGVCETNKEFLDRVIAEIRSGNYSGI